nr:tetratricopeptide repeat protein 17 isoform X2 [Halyomorpha halys]
MIQRKINMDQKWSRINSAPEVEHELMSTDSDCIKAKNSDDDVNLYMNIVDYASDKISYKRQLPDDKNVKGNIQLDCKKISRLDFSMATFPHLQVLNQPWNLTWPKEPEIKLPITFNQIAYGLSKNKTSWYLYNLASLHWRSKGKSQKAIDCIMRAIHFVPREYKDTPLFNLGVMLHRAQCTAEAAILLHCAIDHAPHKPLAHFVLANVYASLGDYNRSIACYDNALGLDETWNLVRTMRHNILCHSKLKQRLQRLQNAIQDIVEQLKEYQILQERWLKSHEEMTRQQAQMNRSFSVMLTSAAEKQLQETCSITMGEENQILSCDLAPDFKLNEQKIDTDLLSLQVLLSKVEAQAKKISQQIKRPYYAKGHPNIDISMQHTEETDKSQP